MKVRKWDQTVDGAFTEAAMKQKLEREGYDVSRYVYPPGTFFPDHSHAIDKIDGVVAGRFRMTTSQGSVILEAGDALEVPRGTVHSAEVVGDQAVVSLDAVR